MGLCTGQVRSSLALDPREGAAASWIWGGSAQGGVGCTEEQALAGPSIHRGCRAGPWAARLRQVVRDARPGEHGGGGSAPDRLGEVGVGGRALPELGEQRGLKTTPPRGRALCPHPLGWVPVGAVGSGSGTGCEDGPADVGLGAWPGSLRQTGASCSCIGLWQEAACMPQADCWHFLVLNEQTGQEGGDPK